MFGTVTAKMNLHGDKQKSHTPQSVSNPTMQPLQYHGMVRNQEATFLWPVKVYHHKEVVSGAWVRLSSTVQVAAETILPLTVSRRDLLLLVF